MLVVQSCYVAGRLEPCRYQASQELSSSLVRLPSSRPAAHRNRGSSHTAAGQQRAAPPLKLFPFVRRTPRDRRRRFTVFRRSPSPLGPSAADRLPAPAQRRSRPAASPAQITFASTSSPAVVSAFRPPPPRGAHCASRSAQDGVLCTHLAVDFIPYLIIVLCNV